MRPPEDRPAGRTSDGRAYSADADKQPSDGHRPQISAQAESDGRDLGRGRLCRSALLERYPARQWRGSVSAEGGGQWCGECGWVEEFDADRVAADPFGRLA
ncbi:hypothetical protein GCM10027176_86830 [Actinoallomurus bryophytorum]